MDNFQDILGQVSWFAMLASPAIAILLWRRQKQRSKMILATYLFIALFISFILFHISIAIIFRDGMGP